MSIFVTEPNHGIYGIVTTSRFSCFLCRVFFLISINLSVMFCYSVLSKDTQAVSSYSCCGRVAHYGFPCANHCSLFCQYLVTHFITMYMYVSYCKLLCLHYKRDVFFYEQLLTNYKSLRKTCFIS